MSSTRQLAAVMFADIEGFTALMQQNEALAQVWRKKLTHAAREIVAGKGGKVVRFEGDGALCSFPSAIAAVEAAIEVQQLMQQEPVVPLRIGIHTGDIVFEDDNIYGDGVNIASRVESFSLPGGVLVSGKVYDEIKNQPTISAMPMGRYEFKNVAEPIPLYAITNPGVVVPKVGHLTGKGSRYNASRPLIKKYRLNIFAMVALLGLVGFLVFKYFGRDTSLKEASIAVLPFEAQGIKPEDGYLIDGMNEDILTQVSKIRDVNVFSSTTMKSFKGSELSPSEIGKQLEATNVLRGTVRLRGNNIRVFAELIDVATGSNVWAQTFDENYEKIFEIQSQIAEIIASVLKAKLSATERDLIRHKQTGNVDAYEIYLKGKDLYTHYQRSDNDSAIGYFHEALAIDPEYALAWAGLADAFAIKHVRFGEKAFWLDSAQYAGERAILLDTLLVEGYKAMASIQYYRGDYKAALPFLEKAVSINPNYSPAVGNLGTIYFVQGNYKEALEWQKKSAALNPRNPIPFEIIGLIYRLHGRNDEAEQWLTKSAKINPWIDPYRELGYLYLSQGQKEKALAQIDLLIASDTTNPRSYEYGGLLAQMAGETNRAKALFLKASQLSASSATDPFAIAPISLGQIYLSEGNTVDADILLSNILRLNLELIEKGSQDDDRCISIAGVYAIRGNDKEALQWLQKAVDLNFPDYEQLKLIPWFNALHGNPTFEALINKIKQARMKDAALL